MEKYRKIEKSIIKTYRKEIWSKFVRAIKEYELIKEGDKIAVCLSGGKDSMLLAKCMQELQRHGIFKFDLEFIVMEPGYSKYNIEKLKNNAELLKVPIHIFETNIFEFVNKQKSPCYLCAKMRRGHLYDMASKLGCNKIALGHHFDDVIETIMLNVLYNGQHQTMMPKVNSDNFEGIELIRPLYFVDEKDVIRWVNYNELSFLDCACDVTSKKDDSKRQEIKELIKTLEEKNKYIRKNIFKTSENANLNALISYKKDGEKINFLDDYNSKK